MLPGFLALGFAVLFPMQLLQLHNAFESHPSILGVREAGVRSPTRHIKDVISGRFALLSLVLGINELGNRLGGSESV